MNTLLKNIELNTNEIDGNGLLAGKSGYIILLYSLKEYDKLP